MKIQIYEDHNTGMHTLVETHEEVHLPGWFHYSVRIPLHSHTTECRNRSEVLEIILGMEDDVNRWSLKDLPKMEYPGPHRQWGEGPEREKNLINSPVNPINERYGTSPLNAMYDHYYRMKTLHERFRIR